jgi:tyrosine-protein phosphatase YwqE
VEKLPDYFDEAVKYLQEMGLTLILAHPERMRAVQDDPGVIDHFQDLGLLLQGNLQCFSDAPHTATRRLAERFLLDGRYFMLGSDTHNPQSLPMRMMGLKRAIEVAGDGVVDRLTRENPGRLMA